MKTLLEVDQKIKVKNTTYLCFEGMSGYKHPVLLNKFQTELGLTLEQAKVLFVDVKQWLALCATTTEHLAPTTAVDDGWHQFILFTEDYLRFCEEYCGYYIHHSPKDPFDEVKDYESIPRTIELAKIAFGDLSSNWVNKGEYNFDKCSGKCSGGGVRCSK